MHGAVSDILPKGKFAELCGVSAGRVSQWIAEGKIKPSSLQGEGRAAQVIVAKAQHDLRRSLDIGQRLGNGIETRLEQPAQAPASQAPQAAPFAPSVEDRIKDEKLKAVQFSNRRAAEEERARAGLYMRSTDAQQQMVRVASMTLKIFEGGLADLANELAARFEIPQRDALHVLRTRFREVRASAVKSLKQELEELPPFVEDEDGLTDVDPAGESGTAGDGGRA